MSNRMQEYYLQQAVVLTEIIKRNRESLAAICQKHKEAKRLCIVGSGSSYNCARMTSLFLQEKTGMDVVTMLPGKAEAWFPNEDDLILMVTQEGKSVNVMRVAKHLEACKKKYVVMTALLRSPTAELAEDSIDLGCGEEKSGPKTKGVLATLLMLHLFALEMGFAREKVTKFEYQGEIEALLHDIKNLELAIPKCSNWALEHAEFFLTASSCTVISVAPMCYLGDEGALKLVETLYLPTVSYEFEEFIHGPHCLIGTEFHAIVMYHGLQDEERLRKLVKFARGKGSRILEMSDQMESEEYGGLRLLPNISEKSCPFSFLLPFQAASAFLAEQMGHDLNRPKYEGFATSLGSKMF